MSTFTLNVTLNTTKTPPALDVDQSGNGNQIPQNPSTQTIAWRLTGNAATGSFHAQGGTQPGFAWIGKAPANGIFGPPTPSNNGNQLSITDLNNGPGSVGAFTYQLWATINGTAYSTIASLLTGTATNPAIINK